MKSTEQKTIGQRASEIAQDAKQSGVSGVFILEYALLELLGVQEKSVFLKLSDGRLLHETPGYQKLEAEQKQMLASIKQLLKRPA